MIVLLGIVTFFYAALILYLVFGFGKVEEVSNPAANPTTKFSIVIPFRNEAENLNTLFNSLSELNYPAELLEIILVNDASEDASEEICLDFKNSLPERRIQLLNSIRRSGSPKKDAVSTAIDKAENEFILTTDADCTFSKTWLLELDSFIRETGAKLVAGPVAMEAGKKGKLDFLKIFQEIDFLSLQGATIGGFGIEKPFLCNGANLCYEKQSFHKVGGFEGNETVASGDDVFLLEKFQNAAIPTGFLKSRGSIVFTSPQKTLRALVDQRIRWAAKTPVYKNFPGKVVGIIVLLMNLSLLIGFAVVLAGFLPKETFLLFFLVKFNVDFVLIYKSSIFFQKEKLMKNYFWCSFIYPFFSSYVALLSLFSGYAWKGRRFKK